MLKLSYSRRFLVSTLVLGAVAASPGGLAQAGGDFGAIAFSPTTHGHGYAYGFATGDAAGQTAVNECEKYSRSGDCISVVVLENGCGALATGSDAYGTAIAPSRDLARAAAIHNCQSASTAKDCSIMRWLCH